MKNQIKFDYDEINHQTWCYIQPDNEHLYIGHATCHEDDFDMESMRTGQEIALCRARIEALRDQRTHLQHRLAALNQLYYSMKHSSHFNPKSYENKMLQRQIRLTTFDLATIKENIAHEKQSLKTCIDEKDKFYRRIRANRNKPQDKSN